MIIGNMRSIVLLVFTLLCVTVGTAQIVVDSLKAKLKSAEGIERVDILNELYRQYHNNEPVLALSYTREALEISKRIGYTKGEARCMNNIGVTFKMRGNYDQSLKHYVDSYKLYNTIQDEEGLAMVYNNIGTIYSIKGQYDQALDNYISSYKLLKKTGDKNRVIGSLNNIGNIYREKKDNNKALEYYLQAQELYNQLERKEVAFEPLTSIGNIYFEKKDYENAKKSYFESFDIERMNKDLYGQAFALHNLGIVHHKTEEYHAAIGFQKKALELAQEINSMPLMDNIYKALSESYYANDNIVEAYQALQLHLVLKDSLMNDRVSKRIQEIELAFQFEKEENEIELLKRDKDIISLRYKNERITVLLFIMGGVVLMSLLIALSRKILGKKPRRII